MYTYCRHKYIKEYIIKHKRMFNILSIYSNYKRIVNETKRTLFSNTEVIILSIKY